MGGGGQGRPRRGLCLCAGEGGGGCSTVAEGSGGNEAPGSGGSGARGAEGSGGNGAEVLSGAAPSVPALPFAARLGRWLPARLGSERGGGGFCSPSPWRLFRLAPGGARRPGKSAPKPRVTRCWLWCWALRLPLPISPRGSIAVQGPPEVRGLWHVQGAALAASLVLLKHL